VRRSCDSFDSAAALPRPGDLLCLEASAGTGKTWSLATLAARYIVEAGQPVDRVVVITFSRASTRQLRDRVRDRLVAFATALAGAAACDPEAPPRATGTAHARRGEEGRRKAPTGATDDAESAPTTSHGPSGRAGEAGPDDGVDPALAAVVAAAPAVLAERRRRAEAALRDFDRAAIFTTHSFCDGMLRRLGVLVDHDASDQLVVQLDDLARPAVADLYLLRFGRSTPPFDLATALRWAKEALLRPDVPLCGDGPATAFTADVRASVDRLKRLQGVYTYDDMPARLLAALTDPVTGPAARDRLATACPVVLVDEFQDTDPVQWEILERAFLGRSAVVVIGDPKQAIYGFRGADVHTYLAATTRGAQAGLTTNRRSAPPLVATVNALFSGRPLGDPRIKVGPVETSSATPALQAEGTPWASPLRLRVPATDETWNIAEARQLIDDDLVADIRALLDHRLRLGGPGQAPRPLGPDDVAVIVSTNPRGQTLLDRLTAAGLPAVFTGAQSVVASPAAADWLTLLRAIAEPRTGRVRAVGLSGFIGWTVDDLVAADPSQLAGLATAVRQAGRVLDQAGPPAVLEHLVDQIGWPDGVSGGMRWWTDLRHVADLLQAARRQEGLGAAGLAQWLGRRRQANAPGSDDSARRLETDRPAIRLMTVHQAKGLQFPVVYLPQAGDHFPRTPEPQCPFTFHDDQGRRWLDLGDGRGPERLDHLRRHRADEDAEQLRLLYVALTRAVCHVTAWWLPTRTNTEASALHRLLAADDGAEPPATAPLAGHRPRDWPRRPGLAVEAMPARPGLDGEPGQPASPLAPPTAPPPAPEPAPTTGATARFDRVIDQSWQRTSYSALTASADHGAGGGVADEPPADWDDDGAAPPTTVSEAGRPTAVFPPGPPDSPGDLVPNASSPAPAAAPDPWDALSPMAGLPGGAAFGSLVHDVFEHADPQDPQQFAQVTTRAVARSGVTGIETEALLDALRPGLTTSLGPLADGLTLAEVAPADRLAELSFELPIAPTGRPFTLDALAGLVERHLSPDDPLAPYPERLRAARLPDGGLRGFLTGSIDVVLRLGRPRSVGQNHVPPEERRIGQPPATTPCARMSDTNTRCSGRISSRPTPLGRNSVLTHAPSLGQNHVPPEEPPGGRSLDPTCCSPSRYLLVDYKTNRLAPPQEPLTLRHYTPARLAEAMMASHYPLQALLYLVALHRFLRWRVAGYSPDRHLAGVAYLFVRGLAGPDTPFVGDQPSGVFSWRPPVGLIEDLDDLVAGRWP